MTHDPTIPRSLRIAAGRYEVVCGDLTVFVDRQPNGRWTARPANEPSVTSEHGLKADALSWAHDWLAEYS